MMRGKTWQWGFVFLLIALSTTIMLAVADENQTTLENQTATTSENQTTQTLNVIATENITSGNNTPTLVDNKTNATILAPALPSETSETTLTSQPPSTPSSEPAATGNNSTTIHTPPSLAVLNLSVQAADTAQQHHNVPMDNAFLEQHRDKLTRQTLRELEASSDNQVHHFLLKHRHSFDEQALGALTDARGITTSIDAFQGTKGDLKPLLLDHDVDLIEIDEPVHLLGDTIPWNVARTGADQVWNQTNGTGIKVAILDTGIAAHPDLNIAGGTSIVSDNYTDTNGHGTAVAGVVAAVAEGQGLEGVAPAAALYAVKIINDTSGSTADAIAGVQWSIDNNMSIIVMSFGTTTRSEIFKGVLQTAYNDGILLIAASGNNGQGSVLYPAAYDSVIAVGATDQNNQRASFSNYGLDMELVAPGVDINTTTLNNEYTVASGTSLAAPHVAWRRRPRMGRESHPDEWTSPR